MSNHGPEADAAWTVDTLHVHTHSAIDGLANLLDERTLAAEKAVLKAERATEERFHAVNEFREQLAEQQRTFMSRVEIVAMLDRMSDRIAADRTAFEEIANAGDRARNGMSDRIGAGVIALQQFSGQVAATYLPRSEYTARHEQLVAQIEALRAENNRNAGRYEATPTTADQIAGLSNEVRTLRDFREAATGRSTGQFAAWQILAGGVGVLSTLVATVLAIYLAVHK